MMSYIVNMQTKVYEILEFSIASTCKNFNFLYKQYFNSLHFPQELKSSSWGSRKPNITKKYLF